MLDCMSSSSYSGARYWCAGHIVTHRRPHLFPTKKRKVHHLTGAWAVTDVGYYLALSGESRVGGVAEALAGRAGGVGSVSERPKLENSCSTPTEQVGFAIAYLDLFCVSVSSLVASTSITSTTARPKSGLPAGYLSVFNTYSLACRCWFWSISTAAGKRVGS